MIPEHVAELPYVSRETSERLERYATLLLKWTAKINLISKATTQGLWDRHIADSLQLWPYLQSSTKRVIDIGSGGGLPVVPLACVALDLSENIEFVATESDQRKATFLRVVAQDLSLRLIVKADRSEILPPQGADIVMARAVAPVDKLLQHADRHLLPLGTALFLKGVNHHDELQQARQHWNFDVEAYRSNTDPKGVILKIKDIAHV